MKQVIVVDESLKLPRGKLAAQVAHASIAAFLEASEEARVHWVEEGMAKVVLKVTGHEALLDLNQAAIERGIPAALIVDGGRTVVPEGTLTCLGLGPEYEDVLDALTGELKLL